MVDLNTIAEGDFENAAGLAGALIRDLGGIDFDDLLFSGFAQQELNAVLALGNTASGNLMYGLTPAMNTRLPGERCLYRDYREMTERPATSQLGHSRRQPYSAFLYPMMTIIGRSGFASTSI